MRGIPSGIVAVFVVWLAGVYSVAADRATSSRGDVGGGLVRIAALGRQGVAVSTPFGIDAYRVDRGQVVRTAHASHHDARALGATSVTCGSHACEGLFLSALDGLSIDHATPLRVDGTDATEVAIGSRGTRVSVLHAGGPDDLLALVADPATGTTLTAYRHGQREPLSTVDGLDANVVFSPSGSRAVVRAGFADGGVGLPAKAKTIFLSRTMDGAWHVDYEDETSVHCIGDDGAAVIRTPDGPRIREPDGRLTKGVALSRDPRLRVPCAVGASEVVAAAAQQANDSAITVENGALASTLFRVTWIPKGEGTGAVLQFEARRVALEPEHGHVAAITPDHALAVLDRTGQSKRVAQNVADAAFLPSGTLVAAFRDGSVEVVPPEAWQ